MFVSEENLGSRRSSVPKILLRTVLDWPGLVGESRRSLRLRRRALLGRCWGLRRFRRLPDSIVTRNFKQRMRWIGSIELRYFVGGNSESRVTLLGSEDDLQLRRKPTLPCDCNRPLVAHRFGGDRRRQTYTFCRHSGYGLFSKRLRGLVRSHRWRGHSLLDHKHSGNTHYGLWPVG